MLLPGTTAAHIVFAIKINQYRKHSKKNLCYFKSNRLDNNDFKIGSV